MSSRAVNGAQLDEVSKYLDRFRDVKREADDHVQRLKAERDDLDAKIDQLQQRRDAVEKRLKAEQQRSERQERSIEQVTEALGKLMDSTKDLADFVKKEYQESRSYSDNQ